MCKLTVLAEQAPVHVPLQTADAPGCPRDKLDDVLEEFSDVLSNKPGRTSVVTMDIQTETEIPICLPPYRVPDKLADKVELTVKNLIEGIIEPSTAAWSSPIVPVVKPSGDIRVCGDYRQLNNITAQIHHYMPELDDILGKIGNSGALSKMDLTQGFHQIVVNETSHDKTTFVCPYGRYRYVHMPFGLKNAPALFQ